MFRSQVLPSNAVCDALKLADDHERGMARMLVNPVLWTTFLIAVLTLASVGGR